MLVEAYTPGRDVINYHAQIQQGHKEESVLESREQEIRDNMLRYLGEYRLGVKFDEISYTAETDLFSNERYLSSGEPGPVRDRFRRAIRAKESAGLSARREVAECLGFEKLEKEILEGGNDLFVWTSPPGSKEEGYGDYSFTFVGQMKDGQARVIPYRNKLSMSDHAAALSKFDVRASNFSSDTDFLANPITFKKNEDISCPEDILKKLGEFELVNTDWRDRLEKYVGPLLDRYILQVKQGVGEDELRRIRNAIENYTLSIRDKVSMGWGGANIENKVGVDKAIEIWGDITPPQVNGSCGKTGGGNGSTLMESHGTGFLCPNCNKGWVKGEQCGECKITKQEWADLTGVKCE